MVPAADYPAWVLRVAPYLRRIYDLATFPWTVVALLSSNQIHPGYGLTWRKRFQLAARMYRNTTKINTGTSYKAHLVMAAKLLELPPKLRGVVVECGSFLGGSATNLSLICDVVGRDLIIYDSFEGLPEATEGDRYAKPEWAGLFRGDLDVVRDNITRYGAIDRCTFRKGWFEDTLPHHEEPVVAFFVDVDYQASLHTCMLHLWPRLADVGFVFIDEYTRLDYGALFFSERYWETYFNAKPPGLMGIGNGVPVGNYFLGPNWTQPPLQEPASIAYTRKSFRGWWDYFPEEAGAATGEATTGGPTASDIQAHT